MVNFDDLVLVKLQDENKFLMVMETLKRIGIKSKKNGKNVLYQSCHILHKQGRYAIVHFKELFMLDGKEANFTEDDKARRNLIVGLLVKWGLVVVEDESKIASPVANFSSVGIIKNSEKQDWILEPKYTMASERKKRFEQEEV